MQYLGGKSRLGRNIVQAILNDLSTVSLDVVGELCAGAGGATRWLADVATKVYAVEKHPGLVAMHRAVQAGWVPPTNVGEEDYARLRREGRTGDPLTTFAEFGCSFGGKSRGGYARTVAGNTAARNYAMNARNALQRDTRSNVEFVCDDALTCALPSDVRVVYCDPPYEKTTGYDAVSDNVKSVGKWWQRLSALTEQGRICYLSEYADQPPPEIKARLVWSAPTRASCIRRTVLRRAVGDDAD